MSLVVYLRNEEINVTNVYFIRVEGCIESKASEQYYLSGCSANLTEDLPDFWLLPWVQPLCMFFLTITSTAFSNISCENSGVRT